MLSQVCGNADYAAAFIYVGVSWNMLHNVSQASSGNLLQHPCNLMQHASDETLIFIVTTGWLFLGALYIYLSETRHDHYDTIQ